MTIRMSRHLMDAFKELRYEPVHRRIRCLIDGESVVDTVDAFLVWEPGRVVPVYAVPAEDISAELIDVGPADVPSPLPPLLGPLNFPLHTCPGQVVSIEYDGRLLDDAAFRPDDAELDGRLLLAWDFFDWWEEDQPVVGHPHDPFGRIDVLRSNRQVVVSLEGQVLAESHRPTVLYETGLPPRWYLPVDDVRMDLLEPSDSVTTCAYKGHASYFSVTGAGDSGRDLAWTYREPLHEAAQVTELICFFDERTDQTIDGVDAGRPRTEWSPGAAG